MIFPIHIKYINFKECAFTSIDNGKLIYLKISFSPDCELIRENKLQTWDYALVDNPRNILKLYCGVPQIKMAKIKFKNHWDLSEKKVFLDMLNFYNLYQKKDESKIDLNILNRWVTENLMYNTSIQDLMEIRDIIYFHYNSKFHDCFEKLKDFGIPKLSKLKLQRIIRKYNITKILEM